MDAVVALAKEQGLELGSEAFAAYLDDHDDLAHFRKEFHVPRMKTLTCVDQSLVDPETECVYLCGNSLGLQPKRTATIVQEELDAWAKGGVTGHFSDGPSKRPWVSIDEQVTGKAARVVGAEEDEVAIMNTLTVNLHLLMVPFYTPTPDRYKIIVEAKAFPSDHFAVVSQIEQRGYSAADALVEVRPRDGEHSIRDEDVIAAINEHADTVALVLIGGVHYYTGQFFDLPAIAAAAHAQGAFMGVDLAHAVGNVELRLHDWDIDFACWCTYKYLNSGPGGIAGAFVHEKHNNTKRPHFAGWWGVRLQERFKMEHDGHFMPGVRGLQLSNPGVLQTVALLGSLEIFDQTSMPDLRKKAKLLTGYLEALLTNMFSKDDGFEIITPSDPERRGCQLSVLFGRKIKPVFEQLEKRGVICDMREPNVMRLAPVPLYNSFNDVYRFVQLLRAAMEAAP
ncbi:kynureninase [Salpingoeca rosetta]|uniref:Kynureninase n=1 Tax=Salpingoeca rosetta (strain ATCC 50818 / BSB-021) TaxID=946362 RepID=F2TX87_SALR5|nr:kynureninase [Salpingoeca rosetta]EGD75996.1 kynureninase [Salpingoeca rosetta]|eukprot:XP_004998171.1 kynureninase [Salpingoeca rosetta]